MKREKIIDHLNITLPQVAISWSFKYKLMMYQFFINYSSSYYFFHSRTFQLMVLQLLLPSITFIWPHNSTSDLQYVNHKKIEQITVLLKLYHRWKLSWDESWDHFYQKLGWIKSWALLFKFFSFILFVSDFYFIYCFRFYESVLLYLRIQFHQCWLWKEHSFITLTFRKLTFLTSWYAHVHVINEWSQKNIFMRICLHKKCLQDQ